VDRLAGSGSPPAEQVAMEASRVRDLEFLSCSGAWRQREIKEGLEFDAAYQS
jgi:hypothetical protein